MSTKISRLIGKRIADRYCITGEIGSGGMGRVFRAISFDDPSQDVAIKVILRDRRLNSEDLLRFQKEASLMSRLHHQNIICFHELGLLTDSEEAQGGDVGRGYYIVMEIAHGKDLKESLKESSRKDLSFFFDIGVQISAALDYTHGKNIVHRDIKPQNIIVGSGGDDGGVVVKVLDFGVARLAEAMHYSSDGGAFEDIAGTPLYMAPEQTNLMKAEIDHRVDLYSLGCVLYEVLAGRPPFGGNSRDKLAKQHVYENPEPLTLIRPDIPPIIENIVHKLLAKHPDDRYGSAFSVHSDLLRARRRLESRQLAVAFPLGLNDRFQAVSAKLSMVGRDGSFNKLKEAYESCATEKGRSRLSVVEGGAGTGKSRVLAEFRSFLNEQKVRFVSANFSRHENALQFNALANGINDYLSKIRRTQPYETDELRRKVKAMLGSTAHLVADVVPGLRPFIEDIPRLSSEESYEFKAFAKAFSDFTRCFAVDDDPVVFIFDDVHWADEKSLELIDQFFSHNNSQKFLLIIAYREEQGLHNPRFQEFLKKFRKLRRRYDEVKLGPLAEPEVRKVVAHLLASDPAVSSELVSFLMSRTGGNPLYVVELVRKLVLSELIALSEKVNNWQYDIDKIRQTNVVVDSIDLVLARIQDLGKTDQQVLEIAAVIGMAFRFELLKIEGERDSIAIMSSLRRMIEEGLVVKGDEDPSLAALGKSYVFCHWRVRDSIYQNISEANRAVLHRAIANRLKEANIDRSRKTVFAMAHHLNSLFEFEEITEPELISWSIQENVGAGSLAWKAGALQSAQQYFENSYNLMRKWGGSVAGSDLRFDVVEALADLAALQKKHGQALTMYKVLKKGVSTKEQQLLLLDKIVRIQAVGGLISASLHLVEPLLTKLGFPTPQKSALDLIKQRFHLMQDKRQNTSLGLLETAYNRIKARKKTDQEQRSLISLLRTMTHISLVERPWKAAHYHDLAMKLAVQKNPGTRMSIRLAAERAALFGYQGNIGHAYKLIDAATNLAKRGKLRGEYGFVCLMRALFLDYPGARNQEFIHNLNKARGALEQEEDRLWLGVSILTQMYVDFISGRLSEVIRIADTIPETIPTRNWLSPRAMSLSFFSMLLSGARDSVVLQGEQYLRRREQVSARSDDLFVNIIQTMITFARGEAGKTRKYFAKTVKDFCDGNKKVFLMPFEEDFVAIFTYVFPLLFEQEHSRRVMRDFEMRALLESLDQRVKKLKAKNGVCGQLISARAREMLKKKQAKLKYGQVLQSTVGEYHLLNSLAHLWFGDFLLRSGDKAKHVYLSKAREIAHAIHANALAKYAEKLMDQREIKYRKLERAKTTEMENTEFAPKKVGGLVQEHLEHLAQVIPLPGRAESFIEESMGIVKRHYKCDRAIVFFPDEADQLNSFYPAANADDDLADVKKYVLPYLNIRSSLFLSTSDAHWLSSVGLVDPSHNIDMTQNQAIADGQDTFAVDATFVIEGDPVLPSDDKKMSEKTIGQRSDVELRDLDGLAGAKDEIPDPGSNMNALVPLRSPSGTVAILFLEKVRIKGGDTGLSRQELDQFGAQLGILLAAKMDASSHVVERFSVPEVTAGYQPGKFNLQDCSWIKTWNHGRLRKGRESCWYFGFDAGQGNYLLFYMRFNGKLEVRERCSALLWYHMHVIRIGLLSQMRNRIEVAEIRDEMVALFKAVPEFMDLESVSIAYSIFCESDGVVKTGHFGPSRPVVVGVENFVRPQNETILTLRSGVELRFWTVVAAFEGQEMYILSHDTSKFGSKKAPEMSMGQSMDGLSSNELHSLVINMVPGDYIPRYYVGAIRDLSGIRAKDENLKKAE